MCDYILDNLVRNQKFKAKTQVLLFSVKKGDGGRGTGKWGRMVPKCKKFIREVSGPLMFCCLHGCFCARKIYWERYPPL